MHIHNFSTIYTIFPIKNYIYNLCNISNTNQEMKRLYVTQQLLRHLTRVVRGGEIEREEENLDPCETETGSRGSRVGPHARGTSG